MTRHQKYAAALVSIGLLLLLTICEYGTHIMRTELF